MATVNVDVDADTDGDGLTDGWEVRYGLDPLDNDQLNWRPAPENSRK